MTDSKIIEGCLKNNPKYQKMLLEKYSPMLMGTAMRYLSDEAKAKDALQDTWIKVFNNMCKYQDQNKLSGWLKTILINTILKMKSTKSYTHTIHTDDCINLKGHQAPVIESNLNMKDLMKIVHTVPPPAKDVFMMNVIDGLSHKEIAKVMNIKESTSRVHLTNARKYLRNIFSNSIELSAWTGRI